MDLDKLYNLFTSSNGIITDSRDVKQDCIFVALRGECFDGNRFAEDALEKGCSLAIIDNNEYYIEEKTILVNDSLKTLQDLANHHRQILKIPIIAITGSNGKTTTKELSAAILTKKYNVMATQGNLNNHIGVPLTLLSMNSETELGIVEMGANHKGEISTLCTIAEPDQGLITNIGTAHIEGFGSIEGIIETKNELYQYLMTNQKAIFQNINDKVLSKLVTNYDQCIKYGNCEDTIVTGDILNIDPYLTVNITSNYKKKKTTKIKTNLSGAYNLENILAAVALGLYFNVHWEDITCAIENYSPSNFRSQIVQNTKNSNSLILDLYNANPTSMDSSLNSFSLLSASKKAVILGDMMELGDISIEEHKKIIELVSSMNLEHIILIGEIFYSLTKSYSSITSFKDVTYASHWLKQHPLENTSILLKASRKIGLERLIDIL